MTEPHTLKFTIDVPSNPNIQSEVPDDQYIRESSDNIKENNEEEYTDVLKVTKTETAFTKGDLKLQKVTVTEEVQPSYLNPVFSLLQSDVITTQPIRERIAVFNGASENDTEAKTARAKTKIPIKKFKETAKKVRKETKSGEDKPHQTPTTPKTREQRKSSIPKLRVPTTNQQKPEIIQVHDEFDKIFEQIIDKNDKVDEPILDVADIDDPVSLELSFHEIAQAYEEDKLQPIEVPSNEYKLEENANETSLNNDVDKTVNTDNIKAMSAIGDVTDTTVNNDHVTVKDNITPMTNIRDLNNTLDTKEIVKPITECVEVKKVYGNSRIPLGRFRSVQEVKVPKNTERRRSLKSGIDVKFNENLGNKKEVVRVKQIILTEKLDNTKVDDKKVKAIHKDLVRNILKSEDNEVSKGKQNVVEVTSNNTKEVNNDKRTVKEKQKNEENKIEYSKDNIVIGDNYVIYNADKFQSVNINENDVKNNDDTKDIQDTIDGNNKETLTNNDEQDIELTINENTLTSLQNNFENIKKEPEYTHLIQKKKVSPEGQLRLKNFSNQFDETSYRDDKNRQAEMDPINTPIDDNVAFDRMSESSFALVKNAVGKLKETGTQKIEKEEDIKSEDKVQSTELQVTETKDNLNNTIESNSSAETKKDSLKTRVFKRENLKNTFISNDRGIAKASTKKREKSNDVKLKDEVPIKISVLSKIAMFEGKEPIKNEKFKSQQVIKAEEAENKPRIVDEVIKTSIIRQKSDYGEDVLITNVTEKLEPENHLKVLEVINLDNNSKTTNVLKEKYIKEQTEKQTKIPNEAVTDTKIEDIVVKEFTSKQAVQKFKRKPFHKSVENIFKIRDKEIRDKYKSKEDLTYLEGENKNEEVKQRPRLERAKSLVDIELGDALVGKVEFVIKNINMKKEKEVKEVINVRERPRKRIVAEKIAIFEKKLSPIDFESTKPRTQDENAILNPEKQDGGAEKAPEIDPTVRKKIDELMSAKLRYQSVDSMPFIRLNDGRKMPVLALGTALLDKTIAKYVVAAAIDLGFRAIDTAFIYGNEPEVGEGIRSKINDGTVKREELFIMSKLWSTFHRPDLVAKACNDTLKALGLDYLDLFMIHNPMSFKEEMGPIPKIANVVQYSDYEYLDAWLAMETLGDRVRSIGVSNFNADQIDRILEKGRVKPVVNQVESNPYLPQRRLSAHCMSKDIQISCYSVLGSKGTPTEYKAPGSVPVIDDETVKSVADELGVSPAHVLIRFQLEKGRAVVVKASSAEHLAAALNTVAPGVKLTEKAIRALDSLRVPRRGFTFVGMGDTHKNYPFKTPY